METERAAKIQVIEILSKVKFNKDIVVRKYNLLFDKNTRINYRVTRDEKIVEI